MKYDGWVPGERDTVYGIEELRKAAAAANVKLLSANLKPTWGENPFQAHLQVRAGELDVCAVALHGNSVDFGPGFFKADPIEIARKELDELQALHCDVTVLLAHMEQAELDKLMSTVPGYDVAVIGHQGFQSPPQTVAIDRPLFGAGAKGRQVGKITFATSITAAQVTAAAEPGKPPKPFLDEGEGDRLHAEEQRLQSQIEDLKKRRQAAQGPALQSAERSLDAFAHRLKDVRAQLPRAEHKTDPRVFRFEWVNLGTEVAADPQLAAEVEAFTRAHPDPAPVPGVVHPPGSSAEPLSGEPLLGGGTAPDAGPGLHLNLSPLQRHPHPVP